jgi:hypothetical protein
MKRILICLLVVSAFACGKDEDAKPSTAQLFVRSWKQTDLLASTSGSAPVSVFTQVLTSCQQDNIWQFNSNGTYTVTEGATKCGTADVVTTGTWTLSENDTKVTFVDATNGTQAFTIASISSTSIRLSGTVTYQNTPVSAVVVFTAL